MKQIGSIEKKIENLMRNLTILLSDKSPHFHGQFATYGELGDRAAHPGCRERSI
jgi:hypothetical protein